MDNSVLVPGFDVPALVPTRACVANANHHAARLAAPQFSRRWPAGRRPGKVFGSPQIADHLRTSRIMLCFNETIVHIAMVWPGGRSAGPDHLRGRKGRGLQQHTSYLFGMVKGPIFAPGCASLSISGRISACRSAGTPFSVQMERSSSTGSIMLSDLLSCWGPLMRPPFPRWWLLRPSTAARPLSALRTRP